MGASLINPHKLSAVLRRTGTISLNALLLITVSAIPALALPLQVPTSVDPGQLQKHFDQESKAPLPSSNLETPTPQQTPQLPKKLQDQLAKKRFVLKGVAIEGATVYKQDDVKFAWRDQLDKEISLVDVQGIVQRITNLYHTNGYILSQAIVPPQDIKDGVLKIRVIEGYISDVHIEGDLRENGYRKVVESYAEHIKSERPINVADLERYLLLIDDLPGATAKGVVRPSTTQMGAAELVVTLSHKAFEASYTLDNRGTKFVGPWEHTGTFVANSLLGMYDRTLLRVITTAPTTELRFFDLQHEEQLDSEGTRLVLDGSYSRTEPGDSLKPVEIVGESDFFQAKVLHPFIRSRQENLVGRVIFDTRDTDTDVFKTTEFTEDKLRVARVGGNYDFADMLFGVNLIDAQISEGLDIFGASTKIDPTSNTHADGTFTKANLDLTRTQPLPHNFSVLTAASGQYSLDPLMAAEQFTLGGVGFGQAYDPAELSGDDGLAGKIELRYGEALNDPYLNSYQLYTYYDLGRVWSRDLGPGGNDKKSLASTGVGLRTNFSQNLSSYLELGVPMTKPVNNEGTHGDSPRFFFSMTGRF